MLNAAAVGIETVTVPLVPAPLPRMKASSSHVGAVVPPPQLALVGHVPLDADQIRSVWMLTSPLAYSSSMVYPVTPMFFQSAALFGLRPREISHVSGMPSLSVSV